MTEITNITEDYVRDLLATIPDPEIPVINIIELGIVRGVDVSGKSVTVTITPTYTGCPAMDMIESDIKKLLVESGIGNATVQTNIAPPWSSDWISDEAQEKLRAYGIAPPANKTTDKRALLGEAPDVTCPHCGSDRTEMVSHFGSTPCKAQYKCIQCMEPFDYFKCI